MINVNQITSQLARMPDQALQKYAMMNKNDPYTVALALSESNRRKAMRAGAAPMPSQQPKVVDQDIAQMASVDPMGNVTGVLPEDIGIGKLPAPNMQRMADGGIVGYSGEDEDQLVRNPYAFLNPGNMWDAVQRWRASGQPLLPYLGVQTTRTIPPKLTPQQERDLNIAQAQSLATSPSDTYTRPAMVNDPRLPQGYQVVPPPANTPAVGTSPAAPAGITSVAGAKPPADTLGKPPAGLQSVEAEVQKLLGIKGLLPEKEGTPDTAAIEEKMAGFSKPAFAKAQEFITKQKDQLKTDKEQDFYMALIEGGLAAAGESGPYALQNIAKGFSKGAGSYATALKDLRKAAQENGKMEIDLARAEAEDKKGNYKTALDLTEKVKDRNAKRDDAITSGIFALTGNINHANAVIQSALIHERAQKATAGASSPLNLYSALGGGDIEKGLKKYTDITGGYHSIVTVENMRKNITDELLKIPEYKLDPAKLRAETQRQLDEQLRKFPNLAQYASTPGSGSAATGLRYNPQTGKIE